MADVDEPAGEEQVEEPGAFGDDDVAEGAPEWVVTFADLMSLLLCFFVLLLSFSRMDDERFKELAGSLKEAFGVQRRIPAFDVPRGVDLVARDFSATFSAELIEQLRETVKRIREKSPGDVRVTESGHGVIIVMDSETLFASGSAELSAEGKEILMALMPVVGAFPGNVHIEGHTDDRPFLRPGTGAYDFNWELSYERALAVLRVFGASGEIPLERLVPIGRGPSKPVASNLTELGRARNRRVELALLADPEGPLEIDSTAEKTRTASGRPADELQIPEANYSPTAHSASRPMGLFPE